MKLWQKVYLITLVLSVVLVNCGIYLVFQMTYKKDITVEQSRAQSAFQMMESSLIRNMTVLDEQDRLGKAQLEVLLETYEKYYKAQNVKLKLWDSNETCIYPENGGERQANQFKNNKEFMTISTKNKVKTICITKEITVFPDSYYLSYEEPLTELGRTWEELQKRYLFMSVSVSVFLAAILFLVLKRLMKPIDDLSRAVEATKEGEDYVPSHVVVKGNDDIARLGESFNEMADIIAENITRIQEEAGKKQQFIDNFAHELKSPLTSIYGFAEYVGKANISDAEKEECMSFIMEESNRMLQLSYTLLDMAKLREQDLSMESIKTEKLCSKVQYQLQEKLKNKQIDFYFVTHADEIYGNELLLQSLIGNLIGNAIYACREGGKIILEIDRKDKGYRIMVRDDGCGMTQEQMKHIVEPFYRVDKARSRENGGTGLGLSLCKQIVLAHQGELEFQSELGEGTTAIVSIPVIQG